MALSTAQQQQQRQMALRQLGRNVIHSVIQPCCGRGNTKSFRRFPDTERQNVHDINRSKRKSHSTTLRLDANYTIFSNAVYFGTRQKPSFFITTHKE